jgi:hypothetical protein
MRLPSVLLCAAAAAAAAAVAVKYRTSNMSCSMLRIKEEAHHLKQTLKVLLQVRVRLDAVRVTCDTNSRDADAD